MRVYAAIYGAGISLRKVQRPRVRDRWCSGKQFRQSGAGDESGDQNLLHREISRDFSDDGKGLGEGRRYHAALSVPDGQGGPSTNWRRDWLEFYEIFGWAG